MGVLALVFVRTRTPSRAHWREKGGEIGHAELEPPPGKAPSCRGGVGGGTTDLVVFLFLKKNPYDATRSELPRHLQPSPDPECKLAVEGDAR